MAAGPQISVESSENDQSGSRIEVKCVDSESVNFVNSDDNNNNININNINNDTKNGSVVESKKGSDSDSKSDIKMKEFVDILSSLKLNPMAKEFFPSSYSPIDRNRDQSEIPVNYFVQPNAFFKNYPENGIDGFPNNRRV